MYMCVWDGSVYGLVVRTCLCVVYCCFIVIVVIVVVVVSTRRKNPCRTKKVDYFQRYRILQGKELHHSPLQLNM